MNEEVENVLIESDMIDPSEFESIIVNQLFKNENVRNKILPYLKPEIFESFENQKIIQEIMRYGVTYKKFPNINEMKLSLKDKNIYEHLVKTMEIDSSQYTEKHLLDEMGEYIKHKLLWSVIFKTSDALKSQDENKSKKIISSSPDEMREALAFSFDTEIGLDLLNEPDKIYSSFHEKDNVISTGLKNIDSLIRGGLHEKTLTLFLGQCVTGDTKVLVKEKDETYEITILDLINGIKNGKSYKVDSPDGFVDVIGYVNKGKKFIYYLEVDGITTKSSFQHMYETPQGWKMALELTNKDKVLTRKGFKKIRIEATKQVDEIYDITVDSPNHRYYTNNVSSHNTNIGKTAVKCALSTSCLLQNYNVLYVTHEMSEEKISERIISNLFDVEMNDLYKMSKDKFMEKFDKIKGMLNHKLMIKEYPTKTANVNHLRNLLKELWDKKKFKPDIIFNDSLNIMVPIRMTKGANTNTEQKCISEELRALAMEEEIPIVSSLQVNRGGMGSSELELTDTAESIGTTTTADIIFGITQTDEMREQSVFKLFLLKNRYGLNRLKTYVGINYNKMRLYDVNLEDFGMSSKPDIDVDFDGNSKSEKKYDELEKLFLNKKKEDRKFDKNKIMSIDMEE